MFDFLNQNYSYFLYSAIFSIVGVGFVTLLLTMIKTNRYNHHKQKAELEMLRSHLEKQIYLLNKQVISNKDRWMDIHHLLIRKNDENLKKCDAINVNNKNPIQTEKFLFSMGIRKEDCIIEDDYIFLLTPFHPLFDNEFTIIKNICTSTGHKCCRGDEEYVEGDVFPKILKYIIKSKLIIANINGRNPNVFYELGIAHALGKPVILLAKSYDSIPFDLRSRRFFIYKNTTELKDGLKNEIIKVFSRIEE